MSAAVRAYLAEKTSVIATLRTLGAERSTIFQTYFLQIGCCPFWHCHGAGAWRAPARALAPVIEARLPIPASFAIYPRPLLESAIYGLLTAFVFTLWPLARAEDVRAATLSATRLGRHGCCLHRAI